VGAADPSSPEDGGASTAGRAGPGSRSWYSLRETDDVDAGTGEAEPPPPAGSAWNDDRRPEHVIYGYIETTHRRR